MKCARFNNRDIHIHTYSREHLQFLFDEARKDRITCKYCGLPLRLKLSIHEEPHFFHRENGDFSQCEAACLNEKTEQKTKQNDYTESGVFRLPKGKAIGEEKKADTDFWTPPREASIHSPFSPAAETAPEPVFPNVPLNEKQLAAVTAPEEPLLVLAGAGSGKTRVLTARAAYMISRLDIPPSAILLVTFTTKAVKEMKERMASLYGLPMQTVNRLVTGTFHSFFYKILYHHDPATWNGEHLLKWEWQKEQYIKMALAEEGLDEKDFPVDQAIQQIGYWKNAYLPGEQIPLEDEWEKRVHRLYRHYEEQKAARRQFDFDDMASACWQLFQEQPDILKRYQTRFHAILIDEFQDINPVQYAIIKLLASPENNLTCVGDDDQSIYAFRGSSPSFILDFEKDYPKAKTVRLTTNYRSSHPIVASADMVVRKNKKRFPKTLSAARDDRQKPLLFYPYDEEEEAIMIVSDIQEKIEMGAKPDDFAILYRTNSSGRAIFERLHQSAIPYTAEQGVRSFYSRRIVRQMLAYLYLSQNQDDAEAVKQILPALFLKQSALNTLKALSITEDCTMVQALEKLTDIKPFQLDKIKKIVPFFPGLKTMKPVEAISFAEEKMGFSDYLKKRGNEGNKLEKGSDDLRDLKTAAKKFKTIPEFLEHVDHMRAAEKQKADGYGVQLLTIHRAKGLEFKTVYILGVQDGSIPHDFALETARKGDETALEEERRLLYVAMTRAEDRLYISVPSFRRGRTAYRSRFLQPILRPNPQVQLQ
ncbi:putative ATP-dependent DNA helicase YjcD [Bacillus licheniformis]|uniref:ATP-dependent helicase n=1 Tax=Bacillus TaxID=1386 RepID=UPI00092A4320|nr:ATP-dependent helicase [Bacillus licheniformis]AVI49020.1 DNA helicase [Bacillus licheniformis]MCY8022203.1 ATP-dependent helicase [Bacillus licheniformis]MEC0791210.1 ATP-dependent helicase [Bacillus licheniformis]OJT55547.1 ATP-dependent DNA helicase Rep [Bacillus licheniformis]OJT67908.1 ATP-dependent DNA helicase Rep [Bacillus licheniformis]